MADGRKMISKEKAEIRKLQVKNGNGLNLSGNIRNTQTQNWYFLIREMNWKET